MIKIELTTGEAMWIYERVLRERERALPLLLEAKALATSPIESERKAAKEFWKIQDSLKALSDKVKTGLDEYFREHPECENESGGGG